MTRLEDALREALHRDVEAPAGQMIDDVRRGAGRRRRNRLAAGVVGTVALVASLAGVGSLLGNADSGPSPAPQPTITPSGTEPTDIWELEAGADGSLLATIYDDACQCTELHGWDGGDWRLHHRFEDDQVDQFVMAPDGRNGWAATAGAALWATDDGGDTWQQVDVPEAGADSYFRIAATSGYVMLIDGAQGPTATVAWRAPVDSDEFERVSIPEGNVVSLYAVGDAVVTDAAFGGEEIPEVPRVSLDAGQTWTDLPYPCVDEHRRLLAAGSALYALCPSSGAMVIHRTLDLATWEEFGSVAAAYIRPLTGNAVLVTGTDRLILTDAGAESIDFPLSGDSVRDAVATDRYYLATSRGVVVSADEGRTWQHLDGTPVDAAPRTVEPTDDEEPGRPITSLPPTGTVPTTIPNGFPLADGMPRTQDHEQGAHVAPTRDSNDLAYDLTFQACDTKPELPDPQDRLTTQTTGVEYGLTRQLTTYADANEAIAAVEAVVNLYRTCPNEEHDGVPSETVRTADRTDVGGESWALTSTQGVHLLQTHVIRVGLGVLLVQESSEGGQRPAEQIQQDLTDMTGAAQPAIAAMCRFTAAGC